MEISAPQGSDLEKIVPDAYHGTHRDNVDPILTGGYKASSGDEQWLGDGIYFVEGSVWHARAHARRKGYRSNHVVVLRSKVRLGKCLDLNDAKQLREIQNFVAGLIERGVCPPEDLTDGFIINLFCHVIQTVDTIRATWCKCEPKRDPDGDEPRSWALHPNSHLAHSVQLAICVRNTANILTTVKAEVQK